MAPGVLEIREGNSLKYVQHGTSWYLCVRVCGQKHLPQCGQCLGMWGLGGLQVSLQKHNPNPNLKQVSFGGV